jgi:hypothetical protein
MLKITTGIVVKSNEREEAFFGSKREEFSSLGGVSDDSG